jgi:hypothetical protein
LNNVLYFRLVFEKRDAQTNLNVMDEEVYIMAEFNPEIIEDQNIFKSDFKDIVSNRDMTNLEFPQRLDYCDNFSDSDSSECKMRTAIYHGNVSYCENFSDMNDPKMKMLSNRCYVSMAIKTNNPDLCEKFVHEGNDLEYSARRKAKCQVDAQGQLLRFEPNYCNTFSDVNHKNYCFSKLAFLTLDESICYGLSDPNDYYQPICLLDVRTQQQRLQYNYNSNN